MKKIEDYLDNKGMIVQKSMNKFNAIDSNFLTTNSIYMKKFLGDTKWYDNRSGVIKLDSIAAEAIRNYTDSYGTIRRYYENFNNPTLANPEESTRYTNPDHVSRDNSMGFLMMASSYGKKGFCREFMLSVLKRFSFFQNTHTVKGEKKIVPDFAGPEQWAILIRTGFPTWSLILMYPFLLVLDFFYLISYTFHVIQSRFDPTHTSTVLHMLSGVLFCRDTVQTPFSYLAEKIFLNFRKQVPEFEHKEPIVSAMKFYSRKVYDAPIQDLVARVVRRLRE